MNVQVRFFASLREATGTPELRVDVPEGQGFEALLAALERRLGSDALAALTAGNVRVAVNQELANPPFPLSAGDEVAFLPPVTGG